jgi:hypothetical protein
MKPNVFLVATIEGIKLEGDFDASDEIDKYHYLTNEPSVIAERLESAPSGFRKSFGETNYNSLLNFDAAVFCRIDVETDSLLNKLLEKLPPHSLVEAFHYRLIAFVQFLWLVKDSDVYIRHVLCITPKSVKFFNSITSFTSHKGEIESVTFSRDEIKKAMSVLDNYRTKVENEKLLNPKELKRTGGFPTAFSADQSRLAKALLVLQVVRESKDLALKISHYCACFEILFLTKTEDGGITHLLAERMAFFLSSSYKDRTAVYEDVREAYRIRCGIFHGRFLGPERQEQLERISGRCDDFLRETLRRILTSKEFADLFADKEKPFNNYFRDLMFGAFPSAVGATSL